MLLPIQEESAPPPPPTEHACIFNAAADTTNSCDYPRACVMGEFGGGAGEGSGEAGRELESKQDIARFYWCFPCFLCVFFPPLRLFKLQLDDVLPRIRMLIDSRW